MSFRHKIFLILFVNVLSFGGIAQDNISTHLLKYEQSSGFQSYNVRKIVQDPFGFMWIACQDGLFRFDGIDFKNYAQANDDKTNILGPDIYSLVVDSLNHYIWAMSSENKLNAINYITGNVEKKISIPNKNSDNWLRCMLKVNNEIWMGGFEGLKIFDIKLNKFLEAKDINKDNLNRQYINEIKDLKQDYFGSIWIFYNSNILVVNLKTKNIIAKLDIDKNIQINNAFFNKKHTALIGSSNGILEVNFNEKYRFELKRNIFFKNKELNEGAIHDIIKDKNNNLLVACNELYKCTETPLKINKIYETSNLHNSKWLSEINTIFEDANNQIWLGCKNGLALYSPNRNTFIPIYSDIKNTKLEHVFSVMPINNNKILAATGNGLYSVDSLTSFKLLGSRTYCQNLCKISENEIIVSYDNYIRLYKNNQLTKISNIYKEFEPYDNWQINNSIILNDSVVILATENNYGILVWNKKARKIKNIDSHTSPAGLDADIVNTIYKDSKDFIWILSNNSINLIDKEFGKTFSLKLLNPISKQSLNLFFDIKETKDYYWIASYGMGLIQLDKNFKIVKIFTTKDGLSNVGIYKIFDYKDNLFITSNYGLTKFDYNFKKFTNYYLEDGLHSNAFEEACGFQNSNLIYAGGVNGFSIINTELLKSNNFVPRIFINKISFFTKNTEVDTSNLLITKIILPNDVLRTKIFFSTINYLNSKRVIYKYRIQQLNEQWVSLGNQNFVEIIGIPHGTYTLQVKAANEDGIESAPIELTLVFLPKWYQTWWFKVLLAISLMGIGFGLYKLRVAQIIKEQKIKNALASDLHDELGSSLTGLKMYAYQAKKNPEYMESLQEGITQSIKQVREMIWQLNEEKLTVHDLINKLAIIYKPLLKINNIELVIDIAANASHVELNGKEKSHLYLILKEIINNALKYSQATELNIAVQKGKNRLLFTIADNGIGIQDERKGYGLKNIEQRAKEIKYSITRTSNNSGTIYTIAK
jgi:signal transduction histidine kinase/ligand-binding sensor domain-containing protein